jgi:hypothetical protein
MVDADLEGEKSASDQYFPAEKSGKIMDGTVFRKNVS